MIHDQFLTDAEDGKISEERADEYLMQFALTRFQKMFLINNHLSVAMIMNGRYTAEQETAVHDWQKSVNRTLGGKFWVNV